MRFQPARRDGHDGLPLQFLGNRPVPHFALAGRELVDPRHEQFLAPGIAQHPHGAAEPPAVLEVMLHGNPFLLVAVTTAAFPALGGHSGALLFQPFPIPHIKNRSAGIPQLPNHVRRATLVLTCKSTALSRCSLEYFMADCLLAAQRVQENVTTS